ncbi:MAG: serine/threonine-protein kinase, partial [Acidobacteriota bacterium]
MREAERSEAEEVERFRRLDELFEHVSALPADQQAARLDAECADDPALRAEVAALLDVDDSAETLLGGVIEAGLGWLSDGPPPPERLGPYRVVEEIGRGGLGTVYLAERDDAEFQMQVAIKVVRPEVRTPELEHRLLRERQILAGLEHPNIAHILDGGTTEDGAPFLVMERIEGEPITSHCRRHGLSIRDQLELFRAVCDAVHYAHRNLVLHRDLKPSNILVTDGGVPKLLDFGIAKVLHGDTPAVFATDTPTLTRPGTRLLTPEYASPEQVLGRPLTTASDVYSLGVLLFELLTGERPYRIDDPRPSEIERVVCGVEPERPRDVLWRRDERPLWGEDLDTIVAMALRKEPERRYASVEQLAEDLRRYSGDLPVLARRDSLGYRTTKFFRRHRVPVVAAALVLTTLLTAVVVTTFQARVAEHESERAEMVADFLVDLFEISDPSRSRGATVTAREVLDQGARRLGWQLRDRPLLRTTLMTTIGRVYRQLGLLDASDELLTEALDVRRRDLPEGAPDVVIGLRELGLLRWEQGALDESEALLREALSIERRHRGDSPSSSEILQDLAALLGERGDSAARGLLDEALAIR